MHTYPHNRSTQVVFHAVFGVKRALFLGFAVCFAAVSLGFFANLLWLTAFPDRDGEAVLQCAKTSFLGTFLGAREGRDGDIVVRFRTAGPESKTLEVTLAEVRFPPPLTPDLVAAKTTALSRIREAWSGREIAVIVVDFDSHVHAHVVDRNREWLNADLLETGRAYHVSRQAEPTPCGRLFSRLENSAQVDAKGLWQDMPSSFFRQHFPNRYRFCASVE